MYDVLIWYIHIVGGSLHHHVSAEIAVLTLEKARQRGETEEGVGTTASSECTELLGQCYTLES